MIAHEIKASDLSRSDVARFWAKVNKPEKPEACWEWNAAKDSRGYGRFDMVKRQLITHRASYAIHHGLAPKNLCVCHSCDNPPCVNPAHLFIGTLKMNSEDMKNKGRWDGGRAPGEGNVMHKLTESQVNQIRLEYSPKWGIFAHLGRKFGVSESNIRLIISGKRWVHI